MILGYIAAFRQEFGTKVLYLSGSCSGIFGNLRFWLKCKKKNLTYRIVEKVEIFFVYYWFYTRISLKHVTILYPSSNESAHEILVLMIYATSESLGENAHPRCLTRAIAVHTHEVWKGPTKNQTSSATGWLGMRIWRMILRRAKSAVISWDGANYFWLSFCIS